MIAVQPGVAYHPGLLDGAAQLALVEALRAILREAPLYQPTMPRTGKPLSVRMSNCGELGWVSDQAGYRYQARHPVTGTPWPAIPPALLALWAEVAACPAPPQACLINWYEPQARMGVHQDRDEEDLAAPVVSVSLGDTAVFRIGGTERGGSTRSLRLTSGDVLVFGGPARLAFHGIDRVLPGTIRSTPWKARRAGPPNSSTSPLKSLTPRVGPLRPSPPIRNSATSPRETETTGASRASSSASWCAPILAPSR
jgi:alkylated DNA repair protein (DNA oxidative demethylase)